MGLVKCSECGAEISSAAKVCPHCGKRAASGCAAGCLGCLILVVIVLGVLAVGSLLSRLGSDHKAPAHAIGSSKATRQDRDVLGEIEAQEQAATQRKEQARQAPAPVVKTGWIRATGDDLRPGDKVYFGYNPSLRPYDHTILSVDGDQIRILYKTGSIELKSRRMYRDWPMYFWAGDE